MKLFRLLGIAALGATMLPSCDQAFLGDYEGTSNPYKNFEHLWTQCDEKYSFFELKGIDWDQIHDKYYAMLSQDMDNDSLFAVMGAMLTELQDDHTNLITPHDVSYFGVQYQSQDNYDARIVRDNYLSNPRITGSFISDNLIWGQDTLGYIRFSSFTGAAGGSLSYLIKEYSNTKGLIFDIRENGGGAVNDVFDILERFADSSRTVFYSRIKNGPGHNDFSDAAPAEVGVVNGHIFDSLNIAVLTDRGTYSAGSFTALGMKAYPHIRQFGDTTGGGLGLPNGGQLPNGWLYRFSITQTLDLDMDEQWEQGVPPDTTVLFDWDDRETDEILEAAIDWLL